MTARIELSTYTGHGEAFAVETNDEMIVLSRLRLNARSAPASTAGIIRGSVILRNVWAGAAYRSADASSRDSSRPASLARTMSVTTAVEKMECATQSRNRP